MLTPQDMADVFNELAIDDKAKFGKFIAIANHQTKRQSLQITLNALDSEQSQTIAAIEQRRQSLSQAIQAETDAIVSALTPL